MARWRAMSDAPLILTLKLDAVSFERLDGLRRAHFPPALNFIPAHLTLFHQLPGERLDELITDLTTDRPKVFSMRAVGLRKLGRGVAVEIEATGLAAWRAGLARRWADTLTAQDRQSLRPHVTIQNKVEPDVARALHDSLSASFQSFDITGEGALLWRYLGGPWRLEAEVAFRP